jgi:RHS repeat-associated protein
MPSSGESIAISGNISDSSGKPVIWTLDIDGNVISGSGKTVASIWDGKDGDDKVVDPGSYTATLTAQIEGGSCSDTETLTFTVEEPPAGQCGLYADFGSSAQMASGALTHSQELFTTSGSVMPLALSLSYDSQDPNVGSLGLGWSHSYDISLKENTDGSMVLHAGSLRRLYQLVDGTYISQPGDYSTLIKNCDTTFTLTYKDGTIQRFAADGTLSAIAERNGNTLSFGYSNVNLSTVTDPAGRVATFSYDSDNHLTSVTDSTGAAYTFDYNGGFLSSVTQPDGGVWRYSYDDNAFMLSKTDPQGNVTTYAYDDQHRVIGSVDPEGKTRSIVYPQGTDTTRTTSFTEKDGGVWQYTYDTAAGTLTSKTDPDGGVTSYTYDASGNRLTETLPDGSVTSYSYDSMGNVTSVTDPLGQTTGYSYNGFGQVLTVTDPQGGVSRYGYDDRGNLTSTTDASGAVTSYAYDARGNVTSVTNPLGQTTSISYNTDGTIAAVTDPTGSTSRYGYDASGRIISQTDGNGNSTTLSYNSAGQVVTVTDPKGNSTSYSYDASGNRVSQTDANGIVTRYEYNYRGQVTKTIDALGNATTFTYGANGCSSCGGGIDKLTALTDANGNTTRYGYDHLGRLIKEGDPLGNVTAYSYDAKGNLIARTDGKGNTTSYSYDGLGRLIKKSYPDATEETYSYDAKGNILSATNPAMGYHFTYDVNDRMANVTDTTGKTISYRYDALGHRTVMTSPEGNTTTYRYDNSGRLAAISDNGTFTLGYDQLGRRTTLTLPNGDVTRYGYDNNSQLTSLSHTNKAGSVIASNLYTLDKTGNRLSNTTQERSSSYSYDPLYRLTQTVSNTPGYSSNTKSTKGTTTAVTQQKEYFTYDPVGNRLTSDTNRSYAYGPANQLVTTNAASYRYDNNGNLIIKTTAEGTTTYAWDYDNRMTTVTMPSGTVAAYRYDPFGRRIEKRVTENGITSTTRYLYDYEDILAEYDDSNTITNRYTHGPGIDEPLALTTAKESYYYHADGLGSIVAMTDASGKVVQTYEYDSFGNLKDLKNRIKQPYSYTGREYDRETNLYYYRARYYDAQVGRFVSKDPISFAGGDVNLYGYVQNNSVNSVDPMGLYWFRQAWQTPGVVGRRGTPVPPGGPISEFIERYVPAGYKFGEVHDAFVNFAAPEGSSPWRDLLLNVPSMLPAFYVAFTMEELRALGILDQLDQPPPQETTPCK